MNSRCFHGKSVVLPYRGFLPYRVFFCTGVVSGRGVFLGRNGYLPFLGVFWFQIWNPFPFLTASQLIVHQVITAAGPFPIARNRLEIAKMVLSLMVASKIANENSFIELFCEHSKKRPIWFFGDISWAILHCFFGIVVREQSIGISSTPGCHNFFNKLLLQACRDPDRWRCQNEWENELWDTIQPPNTLCWQMKAC